MPSVLRKKTSFTDLDWDLDHDRHRIRIQYGSETLGRTLIFWRFGRLSLPSSGQNADTDSLAIISLVIIDIIFLYPLYLFIQILSVLLRIRSVPHNLFFRILFLLLFNPDTVWLVDLIDMGEIWLKVWFFCHRCKSFKKICIIFYS